MKDAHETAHMQTRTTLARIQPAHRPMQRLGGIVIPVGLVGSGVMRWSWTSDGHTVSLALALAFVLAVGVNLAFVLVVFRLMRQVMLLRERIVPQRARVLAQAQSLALEEASQRMSEFLNIAGHELRTPLTTIRANLQLAERQVERIVTDAGDGSDVGEQLEVLPRILSRAISAANRQERLVTALLDVSRIQSGKLSMESEAFDLVVLVREMIEEQRMAHPHRSISLAVAEAEMAASVLADRDRIGQVVTQYLANALKYSNEDRPVWVGVTRDGGVARVSVRDEGQGIAPQEHERVWDLFYRATAIEHMSGSEIGLGLGLHISKTIIERHGGAVGVESQPGEGNTFWFTLPLTT